MKKLESKSIITIVISFLILGLLFPIAMNVFNDNANICGSLEEELITSVSYGGSTEVNQDNTTLPFNSVNNTDAEISINITDVEVDPVQIIVEDGVESGQITLLNFPVCTSFRVNESCYIQNVSVRFLLVGDPCTAKMFLMPAIWNSTLEKPVSAVSDGYLYGTFAGVGTGWQTLSNITYLDTSKTINNTWFIALSQPSGDNDGWWSYVNDPPDNSHAYHYQSADWQLQTRDYTLNVTLAPPQVDNVSINGTIYDIHGIKTFTFDDLVNIDASLVFSVNATYFTLFIDFNATFYWEFTNYTLYYYSIDGDCVYLLTFNYSESLVFDEWLNVSFSDDFDLDEILLDNESFTDFDETNTSVYFDVVTGNYKIYFIRFSELNRVYSIIPILVCTAIVIIFVGYIRKRNNGN